MFTRRALKVEKDSTIFVRNLDNDYNAGKLRTCFSRFGAIESIYVVKTNKNYKIGYIEYTVPTAANMAIREMNNTEIKSGSQIKVGLMQAPSNNVNNVFIKNLDETIDDDDLDAYFKKFGERTSSVVMVDERTGKSKGFGFVCFKKPSHAAAAVMEMDGKKLVGKKIQVSFAQKKDVREAFLTAKNHGLLNTSPSVANNNLNCTFPRTRQNLPMDMAIANRLKIASPSTLLSRGQQRPQQDLDDYAQGPALNIQNLNISMGATNYQKFIENINDTSTVKDDNDNESEIGSANDVKATFRKLLFPELKECFPRSAGRIWEHMVKFETLKLIYLVENHDALVDAALHCLLLDKKEQEEEES